MDFSKALPRSPSPTSYSEDANDQETLPLYTDLHTTSPLPLRSPDPRATPDQVRDFLVHLLQTTRSFDADRARRVAAKWTRGTGRELKAYPPMLYSEIFGFEDGWMVFKEVKLLRTREEEMKFWHQKGRWITLAVLLCVVVLAVVLAASDGVMVEVRVGCMFVALMSGLFLFTIGLVLLVQGSAEDRIEEELRRAMVDRNRVRQ